MEMYPHVLWCLMKKWCFNSMLLISEEVFTLEAPFSFGLLDLIAAPFKNLLTCFCNFSHFFNLCQSFKLPFSDTATSACAAVRLGGYWKNAPYSQSP